jgi:protein-tyrosine kinase
MSKIYQALEKAERERGKGREREATPEVLPTEASLDAPGEAEKVMLSPAERPVPAFPITDLVSVSDPQSMGAEQFRKLRNRLLKLKLPESPRVIMITSAVNGEGKTFIAANLAANIATDLHAKAIIVDCDMRNPAMTRLFGFGDSPGLSDYLSGGGRAGAFVFPTKVDCLAIVPAGAIPENPTDLVRQRMGALLRELKESYPDHYIIIDSTPLLATTEPEVLSKLVDGVIVVVRVGLAARETVKEAIRSLEQDKIVGLILNDVEFKTSALHSRYFGSNGYYYRYYGRKAGEEVQNHKGFMGNLLKRKRKETN